MDTRTHGREGEDVAVNYLTSSGYRIISRNYQSRNGEIDCIAEAPDGSLVFVEVKAGSGRSFGHPLFWVTRGKQRKIAGMARKYLAEHGIRHRSCRFDVIAVVSGKIEHIRNAFMTSS